MELAEIRNSIFENLFEKKVLKEIHEIKEKINALENQVIEKDVVINNLTIELLSLKENMNVDNKKTVRTS